MQATRLMPLIAILLLTPSVAAAQSRLFSFERGVDRPGHAYRVLQTPDAAHCSLACQAENRCHAWTYVIAEASNRSGTPSRCWLKNTVPRAANNDCCISGVRR
jgi:hypothetical protein